MKPKYKVTINFANLREKFLPCLGLKPGCPAIHASALPNVPPRLINRPSQNVSLG